MKNYGKPSKTLYIEWKSYGISTIKVQPGSWSARASKRWTRRSTLPCCTRHSWWSLGSWWAILFPKKAKSNVQLPWRLHSWPIRRHSSDREFRPTLFQMLLTQTELNWFPLLQKATATQSLLRGDGIEHEWFFTSCIAQSLRIIDALECYMVNHV